MNNFKDSKFIEKISNRYKYFGLAYCFTFNEKTQSIYVQDNNSFLLTKKDIEVLIKGLQNSLNDSDFNDEYIENWNKKNEEEINHEYELLYADTRDKDTVKPKKPGYIYFINDNAGLTKIGFAKDVQARFKSHLVSNCHLTLYHYIACDDMETTEKKYHEKYAKKRVKGEWFKLTEKDLKYIKKLKDEVMVERK